MAALILFVPHLYDSTESLWYSFNHWTIIIVSHHNGKLCCVLLCGFTSILDFCTFICTAGRCCVVLCTICWGSLPCADLLCMFLLCWILYKCCKPISHWDNKVNQSMNQPAKLWSISIHTNLPNKYQPVFMGNVY